MALRGAFPRGGTSAFQMTFLPGPKFTGRPVASYTPEPFGPRNPGQSDAAGATEMTHNRSVVRSIVIPSLYYTGLKT